MRSSGRSRFGDSSGIHDAIAQDIVLSKIQLRIGTPGAEGLCLPSSLPGASLACTLMRESGKV
jgi:hypothetical protein